MKLERKQLIEIVGAFSVVVSLLFVGFQLLLDRRIAEAEIYFNRAESIKSDWRARLESDAYIESQIEAWESGYRPTWWNDELDQFVSNQQLSYKRIVIKIIGEQIYFAHIDNLYFQYRQDLLFDSFWNGARQSLKRDFARDPIRFALFSSTPRSLTPVVREITAELESSE